MNTRPFPAAVRVKHFPGTAATPAATPDWIIPRYVRAGGLTPLARLAASRGIAVVGTVETWKGASS